MRDVLPSSIIDLLRDRYAAGVANAEAFFDQHRGDGDSVTGALGQALAIADPIRYHLDGQEYSISVSYRKLRGRGPAAPENLYGSDGIFQLQVSNNSGQVITSKGLPFQSKVNWKGKNHSLFDQVKKMERLTPGGIVIGFGAGGYKACSAQAAIASSGSRNVIERSGSMRSLGQMLSRDFLDCTVGRRGLYYDQDMEQFLILDSDERSVHIISTTVAISPWG